MTVLVILCFLKLILLVHPIATSSQRLIPSIKPMMSPPNRKSSQDGKGLFGSSPSQIPISNRGPSQKGSNMSRSESLASLASNFAEGPEDESPSAQTMADIVAEGRKILKVLRNTIENQKPPSAKTLDRLSTVLGKVTKRDMAIQKSYHEIRVQLAEAQTRNKLLQEELQEHLQSIEEKIPTVEQIVDTVREALIDQATKAQLLELAMPTAVPSDSSTQQAEEVPSYSQTVQTPKRKTLPVHPNKRTLVIKGLNGESGHQLNELIKKSKYSTPLSLERIISKPNCLEVICKSEADLSTLQIDMRGDSRLNRALSFVKKPIPYERMILLNVPTELEADELRSSIDEEYNISERDMIVQRE